MQPQPGAPALAFHLLDSPSAANGSMLLGSGGRGQQPPLVLANITAGSAYPNIPRRSALASLSASLISSTSSSSPGQPGPSPGTRTEPATGVVYPLECWHDPSAARKPELAGLGCVRVRMHGACCTHACLHACGDRGCERGPPLAHPRASV